MAHPQKYKTQMAVPLPDDEQIRKVMGGNYDPATTLNVSKMMAGTDELFAPTVGLVQVVFSAEGISPRTREMIILRAAKVLDCPYEWQANEMMARNTGLTEKEINAAAADGPVSSIDAEYVLVCQATDELSTKATLEDETVTALLKHFGETKTRKIILIIAWFNLLSRFLNGCRVPLEVTDKIGRKTSPV